MWKPVSILNIGIRDLNFNPSIYVKIFWKEYLWILFLLWKWVFLSKYCLSFKGLFSLLQVTFHLKRGLIPENLINIYFRNNKKLAHLQATHVLKPQFKRFFLSLTTTKNVKTKWRTKIFVHSSWLQLKMFIFYFYHSEFFSFNVCTT